MSIVNSVLEVDKGYYSRKSIVAIVVHSGERCRSAMKGGVSGRKDLTLYVFHGGQELRHVRLHCGNRLLR